MNKKYLFIVNPTAGSGKGLRCWRRVERALQKKQIPYQVYFTQSQGDGGSWIEHHLSEHIDATEAVIAVGGDGTANEIINGILRLGKRVPFGLIPAGSGNDLARSLHIKGWRDALDVILSGKIREIDVGMLNDETFFINGIGIGFDGEVAFAAHHSPLKKILGKLRIGSLIYLLSLFPVLFRYQKGNYTLRTQERSYHLEQVWMIVIGNHPTYAGGMKICPGAKSDDGRFQICIVQNLSTWKFLLLFPKVFFGTHIFHPSITLLEVNGVEVFADRSHKVHMDGEVGFNTPVKVGIRPLGLQVFCPIHPFISEGSKKGGAKIGQYF